MNEKKLFQKIDVAFNTFDGSNDSVLDEFYADNIHFVDPVTSTHGLLELKKYYSQAYKNVQSIRFAFTHYVAEGHKVAAQWEMHISIKNLNGGEPFVVNGSSFFTFNDSGKVIEHRDYLDLGELVYEKIPLLGPLTKTIKKRMH